MMYKDEDVRNLEGVSEHGLKEIRSGMKEHGLLEERERINDEKLILIRKIVAKKRSIGERASWKEVTATVIAEERRRSIIERIFNNNDESFALDVVKQALELHYPNPEEIIDEILDHFVTITDIFREIGDNTSAETLIRMQELFFNNICYKFLYAEGRIH